MAVRLSALRAKLSLWHAVEAHSFVSPPYFLASQLTDGGEVAKPYAPAALYPQKDSRYLFLLEAAPTPGPQFCWKD
jgi:hypothetical protein